MSLVEQEIIETYLAKLRNDEDVSDELLAGVDGLVRGDTEPKSPAFVDLVRTATAPEQL